MIYKYVYRCYQQGYCNRVLDFFPFLTLGLAHNEFKFLCVPGTLDREITNMSGTAKVLGSNLTELFLFSK